MILWVLLVLLCLKLWFLILNHQLYQLLVTDTYCWSCFLLNFLEQVIDVSEDLLAMHICRGISICVAAFHTWEGNMVIIERHSFLGKGYKGASQEWAQVEEWVCRSQ